MKIEYKNKEREAEEQTELTFKEYFDDYYYDGDGWGFVCLMKRKWYSLNSIAKVYFYSNSITINLTEENFGKLKERLQKFEDETKIKVNVEVK